MLTSPFTRRPTRTVHIGSLCVGSNYPIRVQSMLTASTMNTEACVRESLALMEAGCEAIRITAPTVKAAAHLKELRRAIHAAGCHLPLVADIHFKPDAALEAAKWVEKVRINPGNFADSKKFLVREYSDAQYEEELERIRERFTPLVQHCQENGVAMRIGTNHGSLSDRIMNRFGDTPRGMVESALEFARIARDLNYHQFLFSMKASNPKVMIMAYRLLVAELEKAGADWNYPLHLGVTEAGDGEDGRLKSAIGIGSLLHDGMGDTIRVSLTEDSPHEIPVARALANLLSPHSFPHITSQETQQEANLSPKVTPQKKNPPHYPPFFPPAYKRRETIALKATSLQGKPLAIGKTEPPRLILCKNSWKETQQPSANDRSFSSFFSSSLWGETAPEFFDQELPLQEVDPYSTEELALINARSPAEKPLLITLKEQPLPPGESLITAFRKLATDLKQPYPLLLKIPQNATETTSLSFLEQLLAEGVVFGSLLCDGIGDAILLPSDDQFLNREKTKLPQDHSQPTRSDLLQTVKTGYALLQAAGARSTKTDYVACPSCGRTLFNLQETTAQIRAATGHLKGIRIAVMGCIVNGPGEMADADFGYVGGAPKKINLYVGKTPVAFNIPQEKAVEELIALIKKEGKWVEPLSS